MLRQHHRVESWTMLGVSWGTTLGLAYAEVHPQRVNAIVLAAVTTRSRREVQHLVEELGVGASPIGAGRANRSEILRDAILLVGRVLAIPASDDASSAR